MPRKLNALEIAEGALLANIAVIFQLLYTYLPFGVEFFQLLIFVVFAILVLRRGLYVGIMSMCVSFFIVFLITGPQYLLFMLLEALGGLFLGVTMKYRFHHLPLLLLGIICGGLTLYCLLFAIFFIFGLPFSNITNSLHNVYSAVIPLVGLIATNLGLGSWWKQVVLPVVTAWANWGFAHWQILFLFALWLILVPVVTAIYAFTNSMVRVLGYDVRPFPDGWTRKLLRRLRRSLLHAAIRRGRAARRRRRAILQRKKQEVLKEEAKIS